MTYRLEWSLLNSSEWCGQPKGYRIWYRTVTTLSFITANVSPTENKFWLPRNLTRYRYYVAYVAAFTSVGDGPKVRKPFYVNDGKSKFYHPNYVQEMYFWFGSLHISGDSVILPMLSSPV